ncbi:VanW family protein [Bacillus sp. REN16]|uniref:VanW family protein n=1 Tax=Bacillus sp. REN16 TaxID=2887296 RepID=UPI001E56A74E|nr:VanW family protein [Bacillus sp. REN16]MCC3358483.1 VanW family protein [Bacillus sp. REN16]
MLFFSVQQFHSQDNLYITYKGNPIATVNRAEYSLPLIGVPALNTQKYNDFLTYLDEQVFEESKDARIGKTGEIVKEQVGVKLNKDKFTKLFYSNFFGKGDFLEVPLERIYPRVDSELLSTIRVKKIGQYVTHFNSSNKERSTNIALSAAAIDSYVLFQNETFSFNQVVGKRTAARGYQPAPEIIRGELIEGIGGGICQTSSTLFNAVDLAGVEIVKRYSHSKRVGYVPPGRDATVSWYGPDFLFKNTYNQPILIRAKVYGGTLIVTVYSSEDINYTPRKITPKVKRDKD